MDVYIPHNTQPHYLHSYNLLFYVFGNLYFVLIPGKLFILCEFHIFIWSRMHTYYVLLLYFLSFVVVKVSPSFFNLKNIQTLSATHFFCWSEVQDLIMYRCFNLARPIARFYSYHYIESIRYILSHNNTIMMLLPSSTPRRYARFWRARTFSINWACVRLANSVIRQDQVVSKPRPWHAHTIQYNALLPLTVLGSSFWTWRSHFGGAGDRYCAHWNDTRKHMHTAPCYRALTRGLKSPTLWVNHHILYDRDCYKNRASTY